MRKVAAIISVLFALCSVTLPAMPRSEQDAERHAKENQERRKREGIEGDKRSQQALGWVLQFMNDFENDPRIFGSMKLGNRSLISGVFRKEVMDVKFVKGLQASSNVFGRYFEPGARMVGGFGYLPDAINPYVSLLEIDDPAGFGPNKTVWHETLHAVIYTNNLRETPCLGTSKQKADREEAYTWLIEERLSFLEGPFFNFATEYIRAKAVTDPAARATAVARINRKLEAIRQKWTTDSLQEGPNYYGSNTIDPECVKFFDKTLGIEMDLLKLLKDHYPPLTVQPKTTQAPTAPAGPRPGNGWLRRIDPQSKLGLVGTEIGNWIYRFVDSGAIQNSNKPKNTPTTVQLSKLPEHLVIGQRYSLTMSVTDMPGSPPTTAEVRELPDYDVVHESAIYRPGARVGGGYDGRPGRWLPMTDRPRSGTVEFTVPETWLDPIRHNKSMNNEFPEIKIQLSSNNPYTTAFDVYYTYNGRPYKPGEPFLPANTAQPAETVASTEQDQTPASTPTASMTAAAPRTPPASASTRNEIGMANPNDAWANLSTPRTFAGPRTKLQEKQKQWTPMTPTAPPKGSLVWPSTPSSSSRANTGWPALTEVNKPAGNQYVKPSEIAPRVSSEIAPRASSEIAPRASSEITPRASSEIAPRASSEIAPRPSSEIGPRPSSEIGPSPSSEITPRSSSEITSTVASPTKPAASIRQPKQSRRDVPVEVLKDDLKNKFKEISRTSGGREAAQKYIESEAESGNAAAQEQMGLQASRKKDYAAAANWYYKAAIQGEPESQNNLGRLYHGGLGVERNDKLAFEWVSKAAQQGLPVAQTNLGLFYSKGIGVKKDRQEAIRWLQLAAAKNWEQAKKMLKEMGVDENDD